MKTKAQTVIFDVPFQGMLARFATVALCLVFASAPALSQTATAQAGDNDVLALAQSQTCPVACLTLTETRSCFSVDVAQTNPNDQGEILLSRPGIPLSITFDVLISACTPGDPMFFSLNGVPLGSATVDSNRGCGCTPGVQRFTFNDVQLLSSAWNPTGTNILRFVRPSTGISYFSWVRATLQDGQTTVSACLNDYQGGNCDVVNQCSAGYISSPVDVSAGVPNPFESTLVRQPYSGLIAPAELDLSAIPDGLLHFCISGVAGRDCIALTKAGQTTLRINNPCNSPPSASCPANLKAECSSTVDLQFSADDPDGDPLSYFITVNNSVEQFGNIPATSPPAASIIHFQKSFQPGTYHIVFTLSDEQFTTECALTLDVADTRAPELGLLGLNPITIECHTPFIDPGAFAADACAGDLTSSIVVQGSVDSNTVGTYRIQYSVADPSRNTSTLTRTVNVVDTIAPKLTLLGSNPVTVECHTPFVDPGATAVDTCAGDLTRSIVTQGTVDANTVGSYTIRYSVADQSGNPATVTRTVNVVDSIAPQLTLLGSNPITVECHTLFVDPGASAADTCAGDLTRSILVQGTVDSNTVGTYTLRYSVSDPSGNPASATRTVNVVDTTRPQLTLLGANSMTVECHTLFIDPGATAIDACAGDLTRSIVVQGAVDPNSVGSYVLRYNVTDPSGNPATAMRTVNVVDTTAPVVACKPPQQASAGSNGTAPVPQINVSASDVCSTTDQLTIRQEPAPGTLVGVGSHTVRVTVTDASGNSSFCETTFQVVNTAPIINSITGPVSPVAINSPVSLHLDFSDAELTQGYHISVDWNDDTHSQLDVATAGGYDLQHIYSQPGVYTVTVTVTDAGGASAVSVFQYVVIYDPSAGFVTGGGWINSPPGAYLANPTLTGKASFGFVAKSKAGVTVPTGQTQFQLKVANFDFHSTAYEWLVVSGSQAEFKGSGTVNGRGDYSFVLTATDGNLEGGPDHLRIRIWDKATGLVVYDNLVGTPLGGGSIVIHRSN